MYTLLRSPWVLTITQTVKASAEAEAYPGPSLVIAYAPCINHGIKKGMSKAQTEEKLAVECGYWQQLPLQSRLLRARSSLWTARLRHGGLSGLLKGRGSLRISGSEESG